MDTPEDLQCYRWRMRQDRRLQNSHTGRYLAANVKISVIIPVYNEAKTIEAMKKQLYPYRSRCEILFVDGGSTDETPEMIGPDFKLLRSEKGRANQMNLGAEESHGDILFFLHCDSELPPRPIRRDPPGDERPQRGLFWDRLSFREFSLCLPAGSFPITG